MQLLVYTQNLSPRSEYTFSTLLLASGITDFHFTADKVLFQNAGGAKINYSSKRITAEELWISPVSLLFENEIKEQVIDCFEFNGVKAFFEAAEGDFPFDIFAASFYLLSRYEEYLPHTKDMYGRYAHENSLAYKEEFLHLPLVNIWLRHFNKELVRKFPSLHLPPSTFHLLPTYDIDIAWSYRNKGWIRNTGGLLHSMMEAEWSGAGERISVLFGTEKDPFDSYQWLDNLHEKYKLKPIYFFLLAQRNKGYDKNILPSNSRMQKLVKKLASKYTAGIHPSWQSGDSHELLNEEIAILEKISGAEVCKSRQHYIRLTLPETYRRLMEAGISEDYSMGYGSINGFRASYCLPYKWYDLQNEQSTSLTIYPFCYMEANSYYEQYYSCEEALKEMLHYCQVTKEVNGLLITIWHNHFLGTDGMFTGWKEAYEAFIKEAIKRG